MRIMAISEAARFRELSLGTAGEEAGEGVALVVLGILALAKVDPTLLNSIAVIVAGIALLVEGAAVSVKYARAASRVATQPIATESSGGVASSLIGGLTGIVLGILAIIGISSFPLIGVALIVFGASVLFDHVARTQMRTLRMAGDTTTVESPRAAASIVTSSNTAGILVSVGLVTLGILVLIQTIPDVLASAAFVALGAYLLLESVAASGWLLEAFSSE
jgi:hypothetical protein